MDKPTVSPSRFVEILNERLTQHPLYREGMHVYAIPAHSDHPRSLVCVGPRGTEGICATIENIVRGECDVFPDIAQDWHRQPPGPRPAPGVHHAR
ncbi:MULTISPECIES: hypothetical protein [Cupriavidus]|uniref:Uncharacterized protein n=1 Tax=Cupriavidus pauculus TaxID=82633 RepID=A0A3G8H572_9BURK|nr:MULTISPECIES: hypothetical protein [Cupriavidus]AZG15594.1 hypothetical protein EHF44_19155 [Cupriavidus pauculus]MDT6962012.1 hypothetical protein [Cupriavidus sp. SZY C1]